MSYIEVSADADIATLHPHEGQKSCSGHIEFGTKDVRLEVLTDGTERLTVHDNGGDPRVFVELVFPPDGRLGVPMVRCSERMPEWPEDESQLILVYSETHSFGSGPYDIVKTTSLLELDPESDLSETVTHWCHMPEAK